MNVALIKSFYETILKVKGSKKSMLADTGNKVEWIPIMLINKPASYMVITQNGMWCVETAAGLRILDNPKSYLCCIVLLETPLNEVLALLEDLFGTDVDIYDVFTYLEIIEFLFIYQQSDYWISLAFEWYEK